MESEFPAYLPEKFSSSSQGTSKILDHKGFGEKIIGALKDPSSVDRNLRFFIKKHNFNILNLSSLGLHGVLVVLAKHQVCHLLVSVHGSVVTICCRYFHTDFR